MRAYCFLYTGLIITSLASTHSSAQLCFDEKAIASDLNGPRTIAMVDMSVPLNGTLDIIFATDMTIEWFENDGSGSFSEPSVLLNASNLGLSSFNIVRIMTANIDADGSGSVDFVAINKPGLIEVYDIIWSVGGARGRFAGVLSSPDAISFVDIDNDTELDLLTDGSIWYEFDSEGDYSQRVLPVDTPFAGRLVDAADLNGINGVDLVLETGAWYSNNGLAWPNTQFAFQGMLHPFANGNLRAFDLNNDGHFDLLSDTGLWFRNNGQSSPLFDLGIITALPKVGPLLPIDLDNDDDLDLVSEQGFWFENFGGFQATFGIRSLSGGGPAGPYVFADIDGDLDIDIIGQGGDGWLRSQYTQNDVVSFDVASIELIDPDSLPEFSANQLGDIDGDGDLDSVSTSIETGTISWHLNANASNDLTSERSGFLEEIINAASPGDSITADPGVFECLPQSLIVQDSLTITSSEDILMLSDLTIGNGGSLVATSGPVTVLGEIQVNGSASLNGASVNVSNKVTLAQGATLTSDVFGGDLVLHGAPRFAVETIDVPQFIRGIQAADMDGDGFTDLIVSGNHNPSARPGWIRNNSGSWDGQEIELLIDTALSPLDDFALADMNSDGNTDLVGASGSNLNVYINDEGLNTSLLSNGIPIDSSVDGDGPVAVGDINGDGRPDIVHTGGLAGNNVDINWYNNSDGSADGFTKTLIGDTPNNGAFSIDLVDLDSDSDLDILVGFKDPNGTQAVVWYETVISGNSPPTVSFIVHVVDQSTAKLAHQVLGADMNGDGHTDVVVGFGTGNRIAWHENSGTVPPTFGPEQIIDGLGAGKESLVAVDLENDGDMDLLSGNRVLYINDGQSPPVFRKRRDLQAESGHVIAFDFENDGVVDFVGTDPVQLSDSMSPVHFFFNAIDVEVDLSQENTKLYSTGNILAETAQFSLGQTGVIEADGVFTISPSSTLAGSGTIIATRTDNAGLIVIPQGSILEIKGDYRQYVTTIVDQEEVITDSGILAMHIFSGGPLARAPLSVKDTPNSSGLVMLGGGLRIDKFEPEFAPLGVSYPIIDVENIGNVSGSFDVIYSPLIEVENKNLERVLGTLVQPTSAETSRGSSSVVFGTITLSELLFTPGVFDDFEDPNDAVLADVTGDGIPDLVVAAPSIGASGAVALLVGDIDGDDGSFQFGSVILFNGDANSPVDAPVAVEVGDFNGDGQTEIAYANRGDSGGENDVHFLIYDMNDSVLLADNLPLFSIPEDGTVTDLAVGNLISTTSGPSHLDDLAIAVQVSDGAGSFVSAIAYNNTDWESCPIDVDDIDSIAIFPLSSNAIASGTAFQSIIYTSPESNTATFLSSMQNPTPIVIPTGVHPTEVSARNLNDDLNGDSEIVIICQGNSSTNGLLTVVRNLGANVFAPPVNLPLADFGSETNPAPLSLALVNIDEDPKLDIAVVSHGTNGVPVVRVLRNVSAAGGGSSLNFTAIADSPNQANGTPAIIRSADLDNDNTQIADDLVVLTNTPPPGLLNGSTSAGSLILGIKPPSCPADLNNDGSLNFFDVGDFLAAYAAQDPIADFTGDGMFNFFDVGDFLQAFGAGCP